MVLSRESSTLKPRYNAWNSFWCRIPCRFVMVKSHTAPLSGLMWFNWVQVACSLHDIHFTQNVCKRKNGPVWKIHSVPAKEFTELLPRLKHFSIWQDHQCGVCFLWTLPLLCRSPQLLSPELICRVANAEAEHTTKTYYKVISIFCVELNHCILYDKINTNG